MSWDRDARTAPPHVSSRSPRSDQTIGAQKQDNHQQRESDTLGVDRRKVARGADLENAEQKSSNQSAKRRSHPTDEQGDEAFDARDCAGQITDREQWRV